jgi:O-antigen/teichoic acid export membrane protein
VWSRLLQQVLIGVEQGFQQYGYLNILNTIQALTLSIGAIWIAWHGGKIVELMQWQALVYGLLLISHLWLVRKLLKSICLKFIWYAERANEIGKHSLTNLFLCIGSVIFGRGDRIAVAYFLSPEILGIYAVITDITAGMNTLSTLPVQPLISSLGNYASETLSKHKLKYQVKQSLELSATLALGIGVWLFALAPLLIQELLASSANNSNAIIALRIAIAIYSLISINAVGFYTLLTLDVALCMRIYIVSASIALSLIILGATKFGLVGALAGNIGFILSWSMLLAGMKKLSLPEWFWFQCLKFPLAWYIVSISIISLVGNNLIPSIGIASFGTLALAYWFIGTYKENKVLATV